MEYFSEIEKGYIPRMKDEIPHNVWCELASFFKILVEKGSFGEDFPAHCPDGQGCYGTDEKAFVLALKAEIINLEWPLVTTKDEDDPESWWTPKTVPFTPDYLDVLDLIQFCYKHVAKPEKGSFHSYYGHYHLISFDRDKARSEFLEKIETLFRRNGLAYELKKDGSIFRILNPSLKTLVSRKTDVLDQELSDLIVRANGKITNPDVQVRYDALKELWDGFERAKTVFSPSENKKASATKLLNELSSEPSFREHLESESKNLTEIGNSYFIRHSEVTQIKLKDSDHIEYLFHRLASFLNLLTKKLG
ncbi:MAG: hypothetical protein WA154_12435 [Moraxellaceae bacterium]